MLSIVALASSLLLLWAALDSGNPGSLFSKFGLPRMDFDQVGGGAALPMGARAWRPIGRSDQCRLRLRGRPTPPYLPPPMPRSAPPQR